MTKAPKPDMSGRPGRLKSRPDLLAVQKGERRKGPLFLLEVLDHGDATSPARVGFTVTRRQGNAVERNRMRRRLREAVRLMPDNLFRPGHDYVLVARRDVLDASFSRLTSALKDRIEGAARPGPASRRPHRPDESAVAPGSTARAAGSDDGFGNAQQARPGSVRVTGPSAERADATAPASKVDRTAEAEVDMPGRLPRTDAQE